MMTGAGGPASGRGELTRIMSPPPGPGPTAGAGPSLRRRHVSGLPPGRPAPARLTLKQ